MDIRDRVILPLHRHDVAGSVPRFDLGSLFLHLLLFDTVIVPSLALLDIAELGRVLGAGRAAELLRSGCVQIRAAADAIGSFNLTDSRYIKIAHIRAEDPEAGFASYFDSFAKAGLNGVDCRVLEDAARSCWIVPVAEDHWGTDAIADTIRDATGNSQMFLRAVEHEFRLIGRIVKLSPGQMRVEEVESSPGEMRLRYRIQGVNTQLAAKIAREACLAIANLNGQFHRMRRDQAITSIGDDSAHLMESQLEFIRQTLKPNEPIVQFCRVSNIVGLPSFDAALAEGTIDIERFLDVRQSAECRDFRAFLTRAVAFNDAELSERVKSLRSRLGNFLQRSTAGKALRVLATTAVSLMVETITGALGASVAAGIAASATDTFVLERLFPSSGVVAFLGKQYPSIFKG
jgi:hypothetical protein